MYIQILDMCGTPQMFFNLIIFFAVIPSITFTVCCLLEKIDN